MGYIGESYWAFSPVISILVMVAVIYAAIKRPGYSGLVLIAIALNSVFYLFYHFHTYYLLPIVPLSLLLVGIMLDSFLKNTAWLAGISVGLVFISAFFMLVMLSSHKYGQDEYPQTIKMISTATADKIALEVPDFIKGNEGPILEYYLPGVDIRTDKEQQDFPRDEQVYWLTEPQWVGLDYTEREGVQVCTVGRVAPVIFGYRVLAAPDINLHYFNMGYLRFEKSHDIVFGLSEQRQPHMVLINWTGLAASSAKTGQ
jgi:hypothetical protein